MSEARRVLVMRHGETAHNAGGVWQGHTDTELSEVGLAQAEAAAQRLAEDHQITRILSSDLQRARCSAEDVAAACGLTVATDARLREIHVGSWTGKTQAEVLGSQPELLEAMNRGEDFQRGGDGESVAQMLERMIPCVDEAIAALGAGETLLIVTHGVSGRAIAAHLVGLSQQDAWLRLGGLGNCHWAEVVERHGAWRIEGWNIGAMKSGLSLADR